MEVGSFPSYTELLRHRDSEYKTAFDRGAIIPFRYPRDSAAGGVLILSILFIPLVRGSFSIILRYVAFSLICFLGVFTARICRCQSAANGYGIGLICAWGIVWSATLLIFNDPRKAFQRTEKRSTRGNGAHPGDRDGQSSDEISQEDFSRRADVTVYQNRRQSREVDENALTWQRWPLKLLHRIDWSLDLVTSFRGPGWNWGIRSLPKPLKTESGAFPISNTSLSALLKRSLFRYLVCYLLFDAFETLFRLDPYFWGTAPLKSTPPATFPNLLRAYPILTKAYRLSAAMSTTAIALQYVMVLNPLFFGGIVARYFPHITSAPVHEPFLYPPQWGPATAILDHGLAGFWGEWWHQMFRHGISEPGRWLTELLALNPKSSIARALRVMIAFSISGTMHACASYTQFADTKPLHPFLFFVLQGVGVLAQAAITRKLGTDRLPRGLRRVGNAVTVLVWAYYTGPLIADDFARGGVWLFEGLPVSVWRGLMGKGWFCWHGKWFVWWGKGPWWERGIAIV